MNYLLDTHTFLWFINNDVSLSATAKTLIEEPTNDSCLSVASVWEIAIKFSLAKLEIPTPFTDFVTSQLAENNFGLLPIEPAHIGIVATLPFHHRDPFDRLIIAQAQHEGLPIIGKDESFDAYGIARYW